ncbi:hypothetical protein GCM10009639_56810 [Kitasatospora putterlickiae]|uniref:Uncharacterized protein n=1 Tax=Kitasatospora putterlickiae TaxID=221725 RepID=A0ABP4J2W3_9ACTN
MGAVMVSSVPSPTVAGPRVPDAGIGGSAGADVLGCGRAEVQVRGASQRYDVLSTAATRDGRHVDHAARQRVRLCEAPTTRGGLLQNSLPSELACASPDNRQMPNCDLSACTSTIFGISLFTQL